MLRAKNFQVRRAAVLGAGVMGAQIAAHFANAGIPVVLFELAAEEGDANAMVKKAIGMLEKLKPPQLATTSQLRDITPANYRDDLSLLKHCDLVIEAIAERIALKKSLYGRCNMKRTLTAVGLWLSWGPDAWNAIAYSYRCALIVSTINQVCHGPSSSRSHHTP